MSARRIGLLPTGSTSSSAVVARLGGQPCRDPAAALAIRALTRTDHECGAFFMSKLTARLGRVAVLWRGNEAARRSAAPGTSRFKAVAVAPARTAGTPPRTSPSLFGTTRL